MPTVETTVWIDAPLHRVYAIAKDNRSFPDFMDDVKSLTVVQEEGPRVVSDWVGVVSAFRREVKWRQEDVWDDAARTCTYRQVHGDYDEFEGVWRFTEEREGTRFESTLNYEYEVPGLGRLVNKVVHAIVVKNMDRVLGAIKRRAEDERP